MGLFDFLFGNKQPEPEPDDAGGSGMPGWQAWENVPDAERIQWFAAELEPVVSVCEKAGLRANPELGKVELRGTYSGRPVAVEINTEGEAELRLKFINRRGHLNLGPPIPGLSDRPAATNEEAFWSDETESVAPLVAPGVAINANTKTVADSRALWDALPESARARIIEWMNLGSHPHAYIVARHQAIEGSVLVGPRWQVRVAETVIRGFDEYLALAELFGQGEAPILPYGAGPSYTPERRTCSYCGTTFFVEASDLRCPACGANS